MQHQSATRYTYAVLPWPTLSQRLVAELSARAQCRWCRMRVQRMTQVLLIQRLAGASSSQTSKSSNDPRALGEPACAHSDGIPLNGRTSFRRERSLQRLLVGVT